MCVYNKNKSKRVHIMMLIYNDSHGVGMIVIAIIKTGITASNSIEVCECYPFNNKLQSLLFLLNDFM